MKVRFLKNHLHYTEKEEADLEISEARLRYWCNVGVCEVVDGSSTNNDKGFDPVARTKELKKLKVKPLSDLMLSMDMNPLAYKNKGLRVAAIVQAESMAAALLDNEDEAKEGSDEEE